MAITTGQTPVKAFQDIDRSRFDHKNQERAVKKAMLGVDEAVVRMISEEKKEPAWMLKKRLDALKNVQVN